MGYRTVAVYSDADKDAPHVAFADEAVRIGPPPVGESYLSIDRILEAAHSVRRRRGASGLRLPVGERGVRAACDKAGLVFIGPPPAAIAAMGNKAAAKRRMIEAGRAVRAGLPGRRPERRQSRDGSAQDRLAGHGEGRGRRRRARHAAGRARRRSARGDPHRAHRGRERLRLGRADPRKGGDRRRATSRSRSSPTPTATSSISASATARCSAATRR